MWQSWRNSIFIGLLLGSGLFIVVATFISNGSTESNTSVDENFADHNPQEVFPFSPDAEVEIWRGFECLSTFTGYRGDNCPEDRPNLHTGIDYLVEVGTPILSVSTGIVSYTGPYTTDSSDCAADDLQPGGAMIPQNDYGLQIIVEDGDYQFIYLHLSTVEIEIGEQINTIGQQIGYVGSRGCDSIPHLHFEIQYKGEPIDPAQYLASQISDSN